MKIINNIITPRLCNIQLTTHKFFEYQLEFDKFHEDTDISFNWTTKRDHAGPSLIISVRNLFWLNLSIYDHRHWDHNTNQWQNK